MDKRSALARAWGFLGFRPWPKRLAMTAAGGVALGDAGLVLLFGKWVDLLAGAGSLAGAGADWLGLALLVVGWRGACRLVLQVAADRATIEAATRLRQAVYHHTFRLSEGRFATPPGVAEIAGPQIDRVREGLRWALHTIVPGAARGSALVIVALIIAPGLALACLTVGAVSLALGGWLSVWLQARAEAEKVRADHSLARFIEGLNLARLARAYHMEAYQRGRAESGLAEHSRAERIAGRYRALGSTLAMLLGGLAALGLCSFAAAMIITGSITFGRAAIVAAALGGLAQLVREGWEAKERFRQARTAAAVVFQFLDRPGEVGPIAEAEPLPRLARGIEFDGVEVAGLLHEITLTIPVGRRLALVGTDDDAKRALVGLLGRFMVPSAGDVRFDQHNLRAVTLDSLRGQIGLVLRDELLFTDTVTENIRCGDEHFNSAQVIRTAQSTRAHDFIQKLPHGYETVVGPLGQALGVGEAFQLALTRAVLRDPALLIVEEPTARLGPDEEARIDESLAAVLPGRTALLLPHREPTLRACDEVLLLHRGRIEARGPHEALLASNELYQHLHAREFNVFAGRV